VFSVQFPQKLAVISREEVFECIHRLAATIFVQQIECVAFAVIVVPFLTSGFGVFQTFKRVVKVVEGLKRTLLIQMKSRMEYRRASAAALAGPSRTLPPKHVRTSICVHPIASIAINI
jgi:hypothetical protein